ncbi:unnamed protein product [Paramecium primaurelia]|uniref:ceramidase n=1 Tax=Paramecium primaurelia TaxID=5886 RepID=A0A8S1K1M9_PARPR|nr:unnamed protein product [Paramecium primaurelia]
MQYSILIVFMSFVPSFNYLTEVEIDLSIEPKQRWKQAIRIIIEQYGYENSFGQVFEFHNKNTFYILDPQDYSTIAKTIRINYPEYSQELDGIVEELNRSEITFEYLSAWAYFYEIAHISTDITESTGLLLQVGDQIIHGRNMDQAPIQARNIILHLIIKKDGQYLGESVEWNWFNVGFITLLKYNVASLEQNWRFCNPLTKNQLMIFIEQGVSSLAWTYRQILLDENMNTFDKVVSFLEQNQVASSFYNVIGGKEKNQGVIISRDPFIMYPTISLNTSILNQINYQYLVQTNYDHWLPDPQNDQRRTIVENLLAQLQINQWNEFGVFAVMETYPIHNEGTFYTIIMNAKYNRLIAFGQPNMTQTEN